MGLQAVYERVQEMLALNLDLARTEVAGEAP
jgi:hypothetical protein